MLVYLFPLTTCFLLEIFCLLLPTLFLGSKLLAYVVIIVESNIPLLLQNPIVMVTIVLHPLNKIFLTILAIDIYVYVCMYTYIYVYTHTHTYSLACLRSFGADFLNQPTPNPEQLTQLRNNNY
jgi:hypothetical protein